MLYTMFGKRQFPKFESVFFLSLVLISALPVWLVEYFPSQDGPIHLWILQIISSYPNPEAQILREFLEPNKFVEPNLGFYLIAYPLSLVFGIFVAEKIFLSLLALIFCYGVRYAISLINSKAMALSYLSIPMVFGYFTHMGFYNYMLGVALFLPIFSFSIFQYNRGSFRGYWKIGAAGLLLVLSHLVPFAAFLFAFGLYILTYRAVEMVKTRQLWLSLRQLILECGALFAALLPGILISVSFVVRHGVTDNSPPSYWPLKYYYELFRLTLLHSFDGVEVLLIIFGYWIALFVAFFSVLWNKFRDRHFPTSTIALFFAVLGLLILYLYAPITSKAIPPNPRLAALVILSGLLLIAASSGYTKHSLVMVLCAAVILMGSFYRHIQYQKFNHEIIEFLSLSKFLNKGSIFLRIQVEPQQETKIRKPSRYRNIANPMLHIGAYLAIEKETIYLRATLLSPSWFAYFPFVFKKDRDPFVILGQRIQETRADIDFGRFQQVAGKSLDFLFLNSPILEKDINTDDAVAQINRELKLNYNWLTSSANGRFQLYESKHRHPSLVFGHQGGR